jgi:uncharacterized protein YacL
MTLSFIRVLFIIAGGVCGYYIGDITHHPYYGLAYGCLASLIVILVEMRMQRVSVRGLSSVVFGVLLGIFMAKLISGVLSLVGLDQYVRSISELLLTLIFSYFGAVMALRGKDEFNIIIPYIRFKRQNINEAIILLDTSAIIDGRISDIFLTKFIQGRLIIARSVLEELQKLSDSENDIKRQRGRRGLETVTAMQENPKVDVHIHEDDSLPNQGVDQRLISLAKLMDGSICTVDYNLGKIAGMQGIDILNVNDLAASVKPVVFSGDVLEIKLIKEGKEQQQGVGYLDDGTMVVVSDGRRLIGQSVKVSVSSILQTQAGKMIFAKLTA